MRLPAPARASPAESSSLTSTPSPRSSPSTSSAAALSDPVGLAISQSRTKRSSILSLTGGRLVRSATSGAVNPKGWSGPTESPAALRPSGWFWKTSMRTGRSSRNVKSQAIGCVKVTSLPRVESSAELSTSTAPESVSIISSTVRSIVSQSSPRSRPHCSIPSRPR